MSGGAPYSKTTTAIANTDDDLLYQTGRTSSTSFSFAASLPNGSYTVTLKFAELYATAAGQRVFNVSLEGTTVLTNFDVFAAAGGAYRAHDRTFAVTVNDGQLNVVFTKVTGVAYVAAIEVVPSGGTATPLTTSSSYRGDHLRHSRTVGGTTTTYTWDVHRALPVVLQDGTHTFVYGLDGRLISQTDAAGQQTYVLSDGLGSTVALTDANGTVTATYEYDVFGAVRASTGTASSEYRFTGQQEEAATGLLYLRARYYDPQTGRFLQRDTFGGFAGRPQSLHRYTYAENNPGNLTDPSGRTPLVLLCIPGAVLCVTAGQVLVASAVGFTATLVAAGIDVWMQQDQDHDAKLEEARAARDARAREVGKRVATVTGGYNTETGEVVAGCSGGGICAEDDVVRQLGGDPDKVRFTEAVRPRTGREQPVCVRCQEKYSPEQFPPEVRYEPGGAWEQLR
jgi:RHS repeat-associated protein